MRIILVITCICLTSKQMSVMSVMLSAKSDQFAKNTEFSGQTCAVDESSFMELGVWNRFACAQLCTLTEDCASIFYSKDTTICHGCKLAYKHNANLASIMTGSEYLERIKTGYKYIGCFGDCHHVGNRCSEPDGRVMQHLMQNLRMTLELCYEHCLTFGLPYYGIESANECFCGDEHFDRDGEVTRCTQPCAGNSSQACGGQIALSVYKFTYGS